MSSVILICGKLCCGKTTYAERLRLEHKAILLSVDEITLSLFGQHCGDKHDDYVARTKRLLLAKSLELLEIGVDVILDWGFWLKEEREEIRRYYASRNIPCQFHYLHISEQTWQARLRQRNQDVMAGKANAYYVDENLAAKFDGLFQEPCEGEIDLWINQ